MSKRFGGVCVYMYEMSVFFLCNCFLHSLGGCFFLGRHGLSSNHCMLICNFRCTKFCFVLGIGVGVNSPMKECVAAFTLCSSSCSCYVDVFPSGIPSAVKRWCPSSPLQLRQSPCQYCTASASKGQADEVDGWCRFGIAHGNLARCGSSATACGAEQQAHMLPPILDESGVTWERSS
jgi:hypothetical protein